MTKEKAKSLKSRWQALLQKIEYDPKDKFYYLALLSAPVLLTVYRYFTEAQDFQTYFPNLNEMKQGEVYAYLLEYFSFFVLFLVIPTAILVYFRKGAIVSQVFSFTNFRKNSLWVLAGVLLVIPIASCSASMPSVLAEYPLPRKLLSDRSMVGIYFVGYFLLYYLPWEFYFRGFLLFGLKSKYGGVAAILIQTISSCLVHIDKPMEEIVGSIPVGILFGIIALNTRSIWYVLILHAALGILTDYFIIF